jgi:hypothetical protein
VKKLVFVFIILGWIGGQPVLEPFVFIGRTAMIIYFAICIFAFYFVLTFDNIKYNNILNQNISKINIKKNLLVKKNIK